MADTAEEFLEHFGVKGMKWGVKKSEGSVSTSARGERRAQYKSDLKSGQEAKKAGATLSEAQAAALSTHAKRKVAATLAVYGGIQVASYAVAKNQSNKLLSSLIGDGEQATESTLKSVGNLSTFVLRQGSNGSWG